MMLKKKRGNVRCNHQSILYMSKYLYIKKKNQTNSISTNNLLIYPPNEPLIGILIKTKLIS